MKPELGLVAKVEKTIEMINDTNEISNEQVADLMTEYKIILQNVSRVLSEGLSEGLFREKPLHNEMEHVQQLEHKKIKSNIKNNNPELHSLKKILSRCQICNKPQGQSVVSHYVNEHPNDEVIISRLAPDVADGLRKSTDHLKCERVWQKNVSGIIYKQICYFCNLSRCFSRTHWIDHMVKHTGYYQYRCHDCSRKFAVKNKFHVCKDTNHLEMIPQPQFDDENLKAYICDLCNFVRFHRTEMEKHLSSEHEGDITQFKEVTFLKLPRKKKKWQLDEGIDDEYGVNYTPEESTGTESSCGE